MINDNNIDIDDFGKNFCTQMSNDFQNIYPKLKELHPEWNVENLGINLMEFGRGQISGKGEPNDKDINFYQRYLNSLNRSKIELFHKTAYIGGCIMGLVQRGHLDPKEFIEAMDLSQKIISEM
jgi:hypothetical protein